MIEVRHLYKSFGQKLVLEDVSFSFERGKTNLIIGASGSGKSVFIKCIVGLHKPNSGKVLFDGRDFYAISTKERKEIRSEIGMLFQSSALFDSMTVEENVMFPLRMYSNLSKAEMLKRVNFCLERVNLKNVNKLFPAEISGGMQKRVGIARAIVLNPKYLFCDEPNSGLDPQTSILIDNLIQDITKEYNITTVVVTHDMNSVMEIGENIAFIYQGKLWWHGNKESILHSNNKELNEFVFASRMMQYAKKTMG
ncbi:MAG: ABC transporter ATP-binding protein [Vicingaceae bacterium]|nr:MAG: ABC transporter ATP-binding protein [Vicingaceae bacterium]